MSRIGKVPIKIEEGVTVNVDGSLIKVEGAKGHLDLELSPRISVKISENMIHVGRKSDSKVDLAFHGLYRSLIKNMVEGVSVGFVKELEIKGIGYRAELNSNKDLVLFVGYSHPVIIKKPEGITFEVSENVNIRVSGISKQVVGEISAQIRKVRKAEPYKGKGIMYKGEIIRRKAGKSGKAASTS